MRQERRGAHQHSFPKAFDQPTARGGADLYLKLLMIPQPVSDTQDIQDKRKLGSNKPGLDKDDDMRIGHGISFSCG
jgi:hypothetical protein